MRVLGILEILGAWHEYMALVPDQQILVSAMRVATPQRVDRHQFNVLVDHPAQQQAFEMAMPKLLAHMRSRVSNDFLTILAIINPYKEIVKPLSPREFLEKAISVNPTLGQFLKDLDIEVV